MSDSFYAKLGQYCGSQAMRKQAYYPIEEKLPPWAHALPLGGAVLGAPLGLAIGGITNRMSGQTKDETNEEKWRRRGLNALAGSGLGVAGGMAARETVRALQ